MRASPSARANETEARDWLIHVFDGTGRGAKGFLRQRSRHEFIEVAVEHARGVRRLHPGTEVLHHLVGLQDVGPDLMAPADIGLSSLIRSGLLFALLQF